MGSQQSKSKTWFYYPQRLARTENGRGELHWKASKWEVFDTLNGRIFSNVISNKSHSERDSGWQSSAKLRLKKVKDSYAKRDRPAHIKLSTICHLSVHKSFQSRTFPTVWLWMNDVCSSLASTFRRSATWRRSELSGELEANPKEFFWLSSPNAPFQHEKKLSTISGFRTKMATRPLAWKLCIIQGWFRRVCCLASTTRARLDIGAIVGALGEHQGLCHKSRCLDCERGEWDTRSSTILIFLCIWPSLRICPHSPPP